MKLIRLIFYVKDVEMLKEFYRAHFDLKIVEEIRHEWVVLQAGDLELALHKMGEQYRLKSGASATSNVKIVFETNKKLEDVRLALLDKGVSMKEIKRYDGFDYFLCDGVDPEGNIFQIMQRTQYIP
jgi:catechol-2,3-dioxygenase